MHLSQSLGYLKKEKNQREPYNKSTPPQPFAYCMAIDEVLMNTAVKLA